MDAYRNNGWPEAKLNIAQAILFAVESPKSDGVVSAISRAMSAMDELKSAEVPLHLRDAHYSGRLSWDMSATSTRTIIRAIT